MIFLGKRELLKENKELMARYDNNKNNNIDLDGITLGSQTKLWWKCSNGHSYERSVSQEKKSICCPYCSNKKLLVGYNDLLTVYPDLIKEWDYKKNNKLNIYPDKVMYGSGKKAWWKCSKCGNEWQSEIYCRTKGGYGCAKCGRKVVAEKLKLHSVNKRGSLEKTNPELLNEWDFEKNNKLGLFPNSIPPGSATKVWWKCSICGYQWFNQVRLRALNGNGCLRCSGNLKKTDKEFKTEIKKKDPTIIIMNEYENARTTLECECMNCGCKWKTNGNKLQQGHGCPNCANKRKNKDRIIKQDEFVERMKKINSNIIVLGEYKTAHSRVKVKCALCKHEWEPLAWDILRGNGCPKCSHTSTSYFEQLILESFKYCLGETEAESRNTSLIGKELDIYIPKYKFAIEPGSWHWHKDKYKNDLEKLELCKKNGVKLIIIYDDYTGKKINNKSIWTYKDEISNNQEIIRRIIKKLLKEININEDFNEDVWEQISIKAYKSSRKTTNEDFCEKINKINPNIELLSEYTGYDNRIKCRCLNCSYEWDATAGQLLDGRMCPKCNPKCHGFVTKTNDEFKKQLHELRPTITALEPYVKSNIKIKVRCNVCGYEWYSRPSTLLYRSGCKECAKKIISQKSSKAVVQYTLEGEEIAKYKSIKEAHEKTGIYDGKIISALKGRRKSADGYLWKYDESNDVNE